MSASVQQPVTLTTRREHIQQLQNGVLDVLIMGGGINGAGIARDLALRAAAGGAKLRIGLVEQNHFASAASGKNSQLIHGGLRYLKMGEFGLVRESLHERDVLRTIAPHLVEPLPFLIPFYGRRAKYYYRFGLRLYDWLAGHGGIPSHRNLAAPEVREMEPDLVSSGLTAGAIYYDCRVHSARLVIDNILDAIASGVMAVNYVRADQFAQGSGVYRVALTDTLSGEIFEVRARKLVDSTGPWQRASRLRLVRGSHIVMHRVGAGDHAIAHFGRDGRIIFVIPWGQDDNLSLVGTTDVDHTGGADRVGITLEEVRYLRDAVGELFPNSWDQEPLAAYSSLRPLLRSESETATNTSREHRVWWTEDTSILHVAGGKYTTYRLMSEQAVDMLAEEIAPALVGHCPTATAPVCGNTVDAVAKLRREVPELARRYGLDPAETGRIASNYGIATPGLLAYLPESDSNDIPRTDVARIRYAIHHEMARRLVDFLYGSTYRGYERAWTTDELRPYGHLMGDLLNWDQERLDRELHQALRVAALPA